MRVTTKYLEKWCMVIVLVWNVSGTVWSADSLSRPENVQNVTFRTSSHDSSPPDDPPPPYYVAIESRSSVGQDLYAQEAEMRPVPPPLAPSCPSLGRICQCATAGFCTGMLGTVIIPFAWSLLRLVLLGVDKPHGSM